MPRRTRCYGRDASTAAAGSLAYRIFGGGPLGAAAAAVTRRFVRTRRRGRR